MDKTTTSERSGSISEIKIEHALKERKRSKSSDSRSGSISSENETSKGARRRSKDSAEASAAESQRLSKAIEEEDAFLEYIKSLPAMSTEKIEAYNKKIQTPVYKRSTSEVVGGLEHLDNLYKLMEHLGQLKKQNFQLQKRLKHLENINHEEEKTEEPEREESKRLSRFKRSTKCKSSHYGLRHSLMRSPRERSRSVGVEEITSGTRPLDYEPRNQINLKAKVSKWTKVKEAFRWEKASCAVLPEAKSQDSGLGAGEDIRFLRVPHSSSDHSSFSVSPADSVLSGQSFSRRSGGLDTLTMPQLTSSTSSSEDEMEMDYSEESGTKRCPNREGMEASRRSKSLDGDVNIGSSDIIQHHLSQKKLKEQLSKAITSTIRRAINFRTTSKNMRQKTTTQDRKLLNKSHKTPWGKVKDIIQTRTGSIKKRRGENDLNDETRNDILDNINTDETLEEELPTTHAATNSSLGIPTDTSNGCLPLKAIDSVNKRRLAPMLTITLPSTEELRSGIDGEGINPPTPKLSSKPPLSPPTEDRLLKLSTRHNTYEDIPGQKEIIKRQISTGGSIGTSPPTLRNQSKWSKVKHAFLTTAGGEQSTSRGSNSVPSSPIKSSSFLYDMEFDELSSGEFVDDNARDDDVFQENADDLNDSATRNENIQAEIQKNFEELQLKLSNEFTKKLSEWDRIKNSGVGTPPSGPRLGGTGSGISSGTSSVGDDTPQDKEFRRKMEEWEKLRNPTTSSNKHRESITLQQLGDEYLSPDFKKKLEQWEKIKSIPIPQTPDTFNINQPQFKKKITEWQRWRPGGGSTKSESHMSSPSPDLPEDFHRKLQEWERLKQGSISGIVTDNDSPDNKSPSPGTSRRDFSENKSSKSQHSPTSKKEKWGEGSGVLVKVHKGKGHHEMKELAWLEKELHKIEREKQRLEREREKYLEREARLEKMRRAIGSGAKKQEILIPTSTGFFRFQGISQKFTRKLYEWEKAKGIGPEASTFALLDPGYQPPAKSQTTSQISGDCMVGNGALLTRSKSVGSVVDVGAAGGNQGTLVHQHSSLSLNNMEELEANQLESVLQGSEEGELCGRHLTEDCGCREPEAMIVDIEDVIEETASPLADTPIVETQTPVYCYAPEEVTRLIDSSGSDSEKDITRGESIDGEAVQSSYQLLEENITLLDKLKKKEDICRELECEMENLEGRLHVAAMIHKEQLGTLAEATEGPNQETKDVFQGDENAHLEKIRARLHELECHQELLLRKGETLQYSFAEHSEQQAALAQHLVGKVKQLQEANISIASDSNERMETTDETYYNEREEALSMVQDLTLELLNMAEKLEIAVGERNQEILRLRKALGGRGRTPVMNNLSSQHWFSTDSMASLGITENEINYLPRQTSEELTQLPGLLTNKVLELKRGLSYLCAASDLTAGAGHESSSVTATPGSPEAETSFVFKVAKKNDQPNIIEITPPEPSTDMLEAGEGNTSPVISFTFTPAFFRRKSESPSICESVKEDINENIVIQEAASELCPINEEFLKVCSDSSAETNGLEESKNMLPTQKLCDNSIVDSDLTLSTSTTQIVRNDDINTENNVKQLEIMNEMNNNKEQPVNRRIRRTRKDSGEKNANISRWRNRQRESLKDDDDDDNDDDDDDDDDCNAEESRSLFETNVTKKVVSKNKKLLKTRRITDTQVSYEHNMQDSKSSVMIENDDVSIHGVIKKVETKNNEGERRSSTSKLLTRRVKKISKNNSREEQDSNVEHSNPCLFDSQLPGSDTNCSQAMTVNVFVPTTRKIFSPVRRDSKGKASSVISYIVEPTPADNCEASCEQESETVKVSQNRRLSGITLNEETEENEKLTISKEKLEKEDVKEGSNFIMPPCWILKQVTRAQSASPALQRRQIQTTIQKDSSNSERLNVAPTNETHKGIKINPDETDLIQDSNGNILNEKDSVIEEKETHLEYSCEKPSTSDQIKSNVCGGSKTENSSSESIENVQTMRKDSFNSSNLKLRTDVGFPPISPLSNRREIKTQQKETSASIRMMIARYNQKLSGSQEGSDTKSPESGSASPVAWRSPVAERRVKVQMERYEDEVRRALQRSNRMNMPICRGTGEVQKSASAGYIRSFDKGFLNDGFNRRPSDSVEDKHGCGLVTRGILKSSSAGAIKSCSPLPRRSEKLNQNECNHDVNGNNEILDVKYSEPVNLVPEPKIEVEIKPLQLVKNDSGSSIYSENSPQSTRIRALRLKKAKEEFLSRGPGGDSWSSECTAPEIEITKTDNTIKSLREQWKGSKNRLSQVSCGSESSYEGSPVILVSGQNLRDIDGTLLIKSASAGMINVDPGTSKRIFNGASAQMDPAEQGAIPKSKLGIFSRFRKARFRRHKEKDHPKLDTVSTLCRQSLVVDIHRKRSKEENEPVPSTSKSCPSSPVLPKRDQSSSSSWIRNPRKIFRPK